MVRFWATFFFYGGFMMFLLCMVMVVFDYWVTILIGLVLADWGFELMRVERFCVNGFV